jgi:hypothetical protein
VKHKFTKINNGTWRKLYLTLKLWKKFLKTRWNICYTLISFRFLHLPLFCAERAWYHAMQLKSEANTEPRKKFHLGSRIKKAVAYAEELAELCKSCKCDAQTQLESQVWQWEWNKFISLLHILYDVLWNLYHYKTTSVV